MGERNESSRDSPEDKEEGTTDNTQEDSALLDCTEGKLDRRSFLKLSGAIMFGAAVASVPGVNLLQRRGSPTGKILNLSCGSGGGAGSGDPGQGSGEPATGGSIEEENQKSGNTDWGPKNNSGSGKVRGYTTKESVAQGEELEFCVRAGEEYTIEIHRVGWYGGAGGRKITTIENTDPQSFPSPSPQGPNNIVQCDWDVTDSVEVGSDWVSGLYYARFVPSSGGNATAYPFVVKEKSPSAAMVNILPFNTMQAYNYWGGSSLYGNHGAQTADAVSFDRPYNKPYFEHIGYAIHLIRWMEKEGFNVSYLSDVDVHREPNRLQQHNLAIVSGHSEYWSLKERNGLKDARDNGTNLAFISGNTGMWRVKMRNNNRNFFCDKGNSGLMYRNQGMNDAKLVGVIGVGTGLWKFADFSIPDSSVGHKWMQDTGFEAGDKVVGVIGHEWDRISGASPDGTKALLHYEKGTSQFSGTSKFNDKDADASVYEADSGATVFSAGTCGYPYRLDPDPTWDNQWPFSRIKEYKPEVTEPDSKLQKFQKNMFDDLGSA